MKTKHKSGFTLVEMIVATLLLAIAISGTMAAFAMVNRANGFAAGVQTATILAQQKMSEIEQQGDQISGGDQQGSFSDEFPGYRWHEVVEATDYPNLFKVTVTVQWGSNSTPNERTLTTFLRNDLQQQDQADQQLLQNLQNQQNQSQSGATGGGNGG
jgi:prepilin-type N-terminal cleavage/methylation domain-containing protein